MDIEIWLRRSIEQNAGVYFENAKILKSKLEGARLALSDSLRKLSQLEEKSKAEESETAEKKAGKPRSRHWYDKFRWFISSSGVLVVLGRDATTNEILIKKHMEKGDSVFHIDNLKGPFCVVKGVLDDVTRQEAANATGSFSEAWKRGMFEVEVFRVSPEQVTKQAQSGEYLAKGMFMIYGKKEHIQARVALSVGIKDGEIMCGPTDAIKNNCEKGVQITFGNEKGVGKQVQRAIGGDLDEIQRCLPAGGSALK
jgi:predicted ribosome quality control (RQC) complex YloA/Tae2 family protein